MCYHVQVRSTGLTALESLLQQTGISAATTASSAQPALPPPVLQAVLKAVQVGSSAHTYTQTHTRTTQTCAAGTAVLACAVHPNVCVCAGCVPVQAVISTDKSGGNVAAAQRIKASLGTSVTADAPGAMDVS